MEQYGNMPPPAQTFVQEPAPQKMGKFKASRMLTRDSFRLLKKDKEIIWFPILSGILNLLVFGGLFLFIMYGPLDIVIEEEAGTTFTQDAQGYAILFVYYLITYFIVTYFQVGLTAVVYERIQGGDFSFKDGIRASNRIIFKIFTWSVIAATVGVIIKVLFERSKALGKIVVWLLGAAWNVLTFFVIPVLLLDGVGVIKSIKNSGNIFRRTWGETLIMNISLSFFFTILILLTICLYIGALVLIAVLSSINAVILISLTALLVIILVGLFIISASLSSIFKVVLYEYARNGKIPAGFTPELITGAIKRDPKAGPPPPIPAKPIQQF